MTKVIILPKLSAQVLDFNEKKLHWASIVKKWPSLKLEFSVFFFKSGKMQLLNFFVIHVVAFDSIKIQTCWAPENDLWNLSFVKDVNVVGDRMTRNGCKMNNSKSCLFNFRTDISFVEVLTLKSLRIGY